MVTKSDPKRAWFDINEVVREVLALARTELHKLGVMIPPTSLPRIARV